MAGNLSTSSSSYVAVFSSVNEVPLTISIWFKANSISAQNLFWVSDSFVSQGWGMYITTSGLHGYTKANSGISDFSTTSVPNALTWHHACLVCNTSSSRTVYLDGGNSTTNTDTRAVDSVIIDRLQIGFSSGALVGDVAEAGVWNDALTLDEVRSLSRGVSCGKVRPGSLVFYTPLIRDVVDVLGGLPISPISVGVSPHPRVYL